MINKVEVYEYDKQSSIIDSLTFKMGPKKQSKAIENEKRNLIKEQIVGSTQYLSQLQQFSKISVPNAQKGSKFGRNNESVRSLSRLLVQITCLLLRCSEDGRVALRLSTYCFANFAPGYPKQNSCVLKAHYALEQPKEEPQIYNFVFQDKAKQTILINCSLPAFRNAEGLNRALTAVCDKFTEGIQIPIPITEILLTRHSSLQQFVDALERNQIFRANCSLHYKSIHSFLWNAFKQKTYFLAVDQKYVRTTADGSETICYKQNKQSNKLISQYFQRRSFQTKQYLQDIQKQHQIYSYHCQEQENLSFLMNKQLQDNLVNDFSLRFIEITFKNEKKNKNTNKEQQNTKQIGYKAEDSKSQSLLKMTIYLHTKVVRKGDEVCLEHKLQAHLKRLTAINYLRYMDLQKRMGIECLYASDSLTFVAYLKSLQYVRLPFNVLMIVDTLILTNCAFEEQIAIAENDKKNYLENIFQKELKSQEHQFYLSNEEFLKKQQHQQKIFLQIKHLYENQLIQFQNQNKNINKEDQVDQ